MSKITLDSVASGYDLSKINDNFVAIASELNNKVLYRNNPTGETNTLITEIDCNDKRLYNLPEPTLSHQVATKNYVDTAPTTAAAAALVSATAAAVSEVNAAASAVAAAASAVEVENAKIVWLGAWSGATAYVVNDAVSVSGSSYICILANTNQTPPNATYWEVLAQQGAAGAGTGDMLATNNLSDVADTATARTNLGVQIGADVQAYDAHLDDLAAISPAQGDIIYFNGTDWVKLAASTAGRVLKTAGAGANPAWASPITVGTPVSLTGSGTTFNIPAGVKKITIILKDVSLSGTTNFGFRLGDAGGIETSGYTTFTQYSNSPGGTPQIALGSASTSGFYFDVTSADHSHTGTIELYLIDSSTFTWVGRGSIGETTAYAMQNFVGNKSLSAELTQLDIVSADNFDAGVMNVFYE